MIMITEAQAWSIAALYAFSFFTFGVIVAGWINEDKDK